MTGLHARRFKPSTIPAFPRGSRAAAIPHRCGKSFRLSRSSGWGWCTISGCTVPILISSAHDSDGRSSVVALQFVEALRYGADLESVFGDKARAEVYRGAADRASQAVYKLCWNTQYGLLADTPAQKHYSQHANILGAWLDVIPRGQQKDVLTKILSVSDAGYTASGPVP